MYLFTDYDHSLKCLLWSGSLRGKRPGDSAGADKKSTVAQMEHLKAKTFQLKYRHVWMWAA